jgi:transcription-repair coupling factor (superfamily II helicase)
MDEKQLEERMIGFLRGDADVLVSTSIIESGIDIPQANTLIVDRADLFGLSQLYQIRGRVGRSRERAYAYLLYPSAAALTPEAADRLSALSDYTELGAGFKVAMRDLELRGAGACWATSSPATSPRSASSSTCRCSTRPSARWRRTATSCLEPVRLDVNVDATSPSTTSLRAGQGRRAPPHRRGARRGRAGGAARRAGRPLRRPA